MIHRSWASAASHLPHIHFQHASLYLSSHENIFSISLFSFSEVVNWNRDIPINETASWQQLQLTQHTISHHLFRKIYGAPKSTCWRNMLKEKKIRWEVNYLSMLLHLFAKCLRSLAKPLCSFRANGKFPGERKTFYEWTQSFSGGTQKHWQIIWPPISYFFLSTCSFRGSIIIHS